MLLVGAPFISSLNLFVDFEVILAHFSLNSSIMHTVDPSQANNLLSWRALCLSYQVGINFVGRGKNCLPSYGGHSIGQPASNSPGDHEKFPSVLYSQVLIFTWMFFGDSPDRIISQIYIFPYAFSIHINPSFLFFLVTSLG